MTTPVRPKRKRGQPTKLTPERQQRMVQLKNLDVPTVEACKSLGIGQSTHYGWVERGREERARLESNPRARPRESERPYAEYSEAIEKAEADAHIRSLGIIHAAARGGQDVETHSVEVLNPDGSVKEVRTITKKSQPQWQAAAWHLERRYPHLYARTYKGEITGKDGGPVEGVMMTADEYKAFVRENISRASHLKELFDGEDDLV